jgi:hypothetical protein
MRILKRILGKVVRSFPEAKYTAPTAFLNGNRRIYHVHIRKTAGTSLNRIFMAASGGDENLIYNKVASSLTHTFNENGYKYTGYCCRSINRGNYFYAYSHLPYWKLDLPEYTFKFTSFRDPVLRVLSHYKMLDDLRQSGEFHPCMALEGKWLGNSIHDFIDNIPKSRKLGIPLGYEHYRKTKDRIFDPSAINRLRDMLDPEYALLDAVIVNNAKF